MWLMNSRASSVDYASKSHVSRKFLDPNLSEVSRKTLWLLRTTVSKSNVLKIIIFDSDDCFTSIRSFVGNGRCTMPSLGAAHAAQSSAREQSNQSTESLTVSSLS